MFRSWYGIKAPMLNSEGIELSAIYGFFNTILKLINSIKPTHIGVAFDTKGPTFRNKMYTEYKANRSEAPNELKIQLNLITQELPNTNIESFSEKNFEADDILGTLSNKLSQNKDDEVFIFSGDSDLHQLVKENVYIVTTSKTGDLKTFNEEEIKNTYLGLSPDQIIDYKSLTGDSSDNIPGIPGVGKKTAIKLLNEYKTIDNVFSNLDKIPQEKLRSNLDTYAKNSIRAKSLVELKLDVDIEIDFNKLNISNINKSGLLNLFEKFEFKSLSSRYQKSLFNESNTESIEGKSKNQKRFKLHIIDDVKKLDKLIVKLYDQKEIAFDTETTSLSMIDNNIVGISLSYNESEGFYLPLQHTNDNNLPILETLQKLKPIFESEKILKIGHNINFDHSVLLSQYKKLNEHITINNFKFDTLIAAHLLNYRNLGLKNISNDLFNVNLTQLSEIIGKGKTISNIADKTVNQIAEYAINDAIYTYKLKTIFEKELKINNLDDLFNNIEMELIPILICMQNFGMPINIKYLNDLNKTFAKKIIILESRAKELTNEEINLNSPQQLSKILFEKFDLPKTKKTKSGYSTDSQSITDLKDKLVEKFKSKTNYTPALEDSRNLQFLELIQEYRELSKLLSSYINTLPKLINQNTNRIHTKFNQSGTSTGRLSSNEPNLQTIPKKTLSGKLVRAAFEVQIDNHQFISADYSQIELRVLAHFSKDQNLIDAFKNGEDIHNFTAATMYGCGIENVTEDMRRIAKILNFGVLYGLSPYGISKQTDLSVNQGKDFIEIYFKRFPQISDYINKTKSDVKDKGYVETIFGRKRHIPEIYANDKRIQAHAERMAINMPIQGSAAEIIKLSMIKIHTELENKKLQSKMLLQVLDEIIFESEKSETKELINILTIIMTNVVQLVVPLNINLQIGSNLGEMK